MAPVAFAHAGLAVVGIEHIVEDDHALAGAVAPARHEEGGLEVLCACLLIEGGARQQVHLGLDAHLLQIAGNGLRHLIGVHVTVVAGIDAEIEAIGIASLRQKLLGKLGIVGGTLCVGIISHTDAGHIGVSHGGVAVHDGIDDRLNVNGVVNGLTNLHIEERVGIVGAGRAMLIELIKAHVVAGQAGIGNDLDVGVVLQAVHVHHRDVGDKVHLSVDESGGAGSCIGDHAELHGLCIRQLAPILVVADQLDIGFLYMLHQTIPAGTHGVRGDLLAGKSLTGLLVKHHDMDQAAVKHGIGDLGHQLHGVIIHLLDLLKTHEVHAHLQSRIVEDALKAEDHVIGIEVVSVGELHAMAELELPRHAVIQNSPALCQTGLPAQICIIVHQSVVQVRCHLHLDAAVLYRGVQRDNIIQHRDGQALFAVIRGVALLRFVCPTAGQGHRETQSYGQEHCDGSLFHSCFSFKKISYLTRCVVYRYH